MWCADWPVASAGSLPCTPTVVVHANRVVSCTPAAREGGVRRGQRRREAQACSPDVIVIERDVSREARGFEPVLEVIESFTPRLELTRPGSCAFATRGPSRYFGGDASLAAQLVERVDSVLEPLGWDGHVRVGVADGPFAAGLAARFPTSDGCRSTIVDRLGTPSFLRPFPVDVLEQPELVDVLHRLGVATLGELASLHESDLLARFGTQGQGAHRLASGLDHRPPGASAAPPDLVVHAELDPPGERVDAVAFEAKMLADDLFARLDALALSCTRVLVGVETEHGETCERLWRHEGSLTAAAVADRMRWQLDGWLHGSSAVRPTGGVVLLRLAPDEVVPAHGRQLGFWGSETAVSERAARAVARVQGLLGPDAVRVIEHTGGRGPGERVRLVPASAIDLTADRPSAHTSWVRQPWPGQVPPPAPAVIHDPLMPVEVLDETGSPVRVSGRGAASAPPVIVKLDQRMATVTSWAGPWTADERWWDPGLHRRRARFQVVLDETTAHLLTLEGGRWWIEATYD